MAIILCNSLIGSEAEMALNIVVNLHILSHSRIRPLPDTKLIRERDLVHER
jgi:hypothetical protein